MLWAGLRICNVLTVLILHFWAVLHNLRSLWVKFRPCGPFPEAPSPPGRSLAQSSSPSGLTLASSWPLCPFGEGHCQYTQGLLKCLPAFVRLYVAGAGLTSKRPGSGEPAGISPFHLPFCMCDVISFLKKHVSAPAKYDCSCHILASKARGRF